MAKNNNIYSTSQLDTLKRELNGVVEYLQSLDLSKVKDDVDWKVTAKGGMIPSIVSTEEEIIETVVGEIKKSGGIISAIFEAEGTSDLLQSQIEVTVNKLNELQDHFFKINQIDIVHRKIEIPVGKNKDGSPKIVRVVAATKERQIKARSKITESIMRILPMIDTIKEYKTVEARGKTEITEAMKRFLKRLGRYE